MKNYIIIFLFFCSLYSCQNKEKATNLNQDNSQIDEVTYLKEFEGSKVPLFFNNKEYTVTKRVTTIKDVSYVATILPNEYFVKKNSGVKDKDSINTILEEVKNEVIVQIDFHHTEKKDLFSEKLNKHNYDQLLNYVNNRVKNDFYAIVNKKDTIQVKGVHFERSYKLRPYKRILLYFNKKHRNELENFKLIYNDKIFNNGIIKFNLKTN